MQIQFSVNVLLESIAAMALVAFTLGWALAVAFHRYTWGLLSIHAAASGRPVSTPAYDLARFVEAVERGLGTFFRSTSNWKWRL